MSIAKESRLTLDEYEKERDFHDEDLSKIKQLKCVKSLNAKRYECTTGNWNFSKN